MVLTVSYTDVYRYCKPSSLKFDFSAGQGGEIKVSASFMALAYQLAGATSVSPASLRALGTPLMWHDVREFSIESGGPTPTTKSYRRALMSLSATLEYNLERKNQRPNWGDHEPLSRTSYALLEHHLNVSGEIGLHERLSSELFSSIANAQDWGDIKIVCSNSLDAGDTASKGITLNFEGCFPSDEKAAGGESSAEIDHNVAFTANTVSITVDA